MKKIVFTTEKKIMACGCRFEWCKEHQVDNPENLVEVNQPPEKWEKRLEEIWGKTYSGSGGTIGELKFHSVQYEDLKSFIKQTIAQEKKELVERIKHMIDKKIEKLHQNESKYKSDLQRHINYAARGSVLNQFRHELSQLLEGEK